MYATILFLCGLMAAISSVALGYAAGQFKAAGAPGWWHEVALAIVMALVAGGVVYVGLRCRRRVTPVPSTPEDPTRKHCRHYGMPD